MAIQDYISSYTGEQIDNFNIRITAVENGKAPNSHAVDANTYGLGNTSAYGHVKLSDSTTSTSTASAGIAATPKAVKEAYDLANGKLGAPVLLWTNPSPTTSFTNGNPAIQMTGLEQYSLFAIQVRRSSSIDSMSMFFTFYNINKVMMQFYGGQITHRNFRPQVDGFYFSDGYWTKSYSSETNDNTVMIPQKIWGFK